MPAVEILDRTAVLRVTLNIDPLDPAAIDEVVDVEAAPGGAEGRIDIGLFNAKRTDLFVVDFDLQRRNIFQSARPDAGKRGIGGGGRQQLIAPLLELRQAEVVIVEELHRQAVRLAETLHRRRCEGEELRVAQAAAKRSRGSGNDRGCGVFLTVTLLPGLELDEALADVLAGSATCPKSLRSSPVPGA